MSDSSFDGDGRNGGGSGGGMSDGDEFDAPAAAPPKERRTRFTFRRSRHLLTTGCAFLLADGTIRQPPGTVAFWVHMQVCAISRRTSTQLRWVLVALYSSSVF